MSASVGSIKGSGLQGVYPGSLSEKNFDVEIFQKHLEAAKRSNDHGVKKVEFEKAFQLIRPHLPKANPAFYKLIHEYGSQVCYNQVVDGNLQKGFWQSAQLMELSAALQLQDLFLMKLDFQAAKFESISALIQHLETSPIFFIDAFGNTPLSKEVALKKFDDPEKKQVFADTLIRINYSHQNIDFYKAKGFAFHQNSTDFTEAVIGAATESEMQKLAEYRYNRCLFLARLKNPADAESHLKSYDPVVELFKKCYEENDPQLLGKLSQVHNMLGIQYYQRSDLETAESHHREAFKARKKLLEDPAEKTNQETHQFLLANIRTSLVHELLERDPTQERIQEALLHAQALGELIKDYSQNQNANTYRQNWLNAAQYAGLKAAQLLADLAIEK